MFSCLLVLSHLSSSCFSLFISVYLFLALFVFVILCSLLVSLYDDYPGMGTVVVIPVLMSHLSQCVTVLLSDQPWGK